MEAIYKHYVLMRYNLALYSSNPYKVKDKDNWMKHRIKLFKRCLKSLEMQTNQDFTVVLALDSKTPKTYIAEIVFLLDMSGVDYELSYDKQPNKWIEENKPSTEWLITTRLDNDDEVLSKFIDTIQKSFSNKTELIDVKGVKMMNDEIHPYNRTTVGSPFISLVEHTRQCKTAMYKTHSLMPTFYPNRFVSDEPLFIQHIHDKNQSNTLIQG